MLSKVCTQNNTSTGLIITIPWERKVSHFPCPPLFPHTISLIIYNKTPKQQKKTTLRLKYSQPHTDKPTCIWMPLLSLLFTHTLTRPTRSSATRSFMMPWISMFCSPPSRPAVNTSFSSTTMCTLTNSTPQLIIATCMEFLFLHQNMYINKRHHTVLYTYNIQSSNWLTIWCTLTNTLHNITRTVYRVPTHSPPLGVYTDKHHITNNNTIYGIPSPDLPTPKYFCQYSEQSMSVFSDFWPDILRMHHQSVKTKQCQRSILLLIIHLVKTVCELTSSTIQTHYTPTILVCLHLRKSFSIEDHRTLSPKTMHCVCCFSRCRRSLSWTVVAWSEFVSLISCILSPLCWFHAATCH